MAADAGMAAAIALWLGGAALAGFAIGLGLLLLAVALSWWALGRWAVTGETSRLPALAFLLLRIGLGFALLVAAAWLFAELAEALGAGTVLGPIDRAFADAVGRSVPLPALRFFAAVTHLADTATLTGLGGAVAAALWWRGERGLALAWLGAVAGNAVLNVALKEIFARLRPLHDGGLVLAHGYSFPSGHSSGSVVAYGMLAYLALRLLPRPWHLPATLLAVALAFTIGSSRVFLQVHHASDVLAGFASGSAWLAVCIFSVEGMRRYRRSRR